MVYQAVWTIHANSEFKLELEAVSFPEQETEPDWFCFQIVIFTWLKFIYGHENCLNQEDDM